MFIIHGHFRVKPGQEAAFRNATIENARYSIQEQGIARFDIVQSVEDPTRFVLVEVFRSPEAVDQHRETAHFRKWRAATDPMLAEERDVRKYHIVWPEETEWE